MFLYFCMINNVAEIYKAQYLMCMFLHGVLSDGTKSAYT